MIIQSSLFWLWVGIGVAVAVVAVFVVVFWRVGWDRTANDLEIWKAAARKIVRLTHGLGLP